MKILIACEFSGINREAFAALGHDVTSCDINYDTEIPGNHYFGDVMDILYDPWDMIIAHPPCRYLANSGVRWLSTEEGRWEKMLAGAEFFKLFLNHPCERIAIENSVMHKYAIEAIGGKKQDQTVQPYHFGVMRTKRICWWLKGMPLLTETNNVYAEMMKLKYSERAKVHYEGPGPDREKNRSRWIPEVGAAMAQQWGNLYRYRITYVDDERGDSLREWEGYATDSSDALNQAQENDYYFGRVVSSEEIGR